MFKQRRFSSADPACAVTEVPRFVSVTYAFVSCQRSEMPEGAGREHKGCIVGETAAC